MAIKKTTKGPVPKSVAKKAVKVAKSATKEGISEAMGSPRKKQELTKEQKQGLFNQTLVQGGSKNPAINPEKYYPSMYGKGRVGDKVGSAMKITKKTMKPLSKKK
jgi:hypothetical protein